MEEDQLNELIKAKLLNIVNTFNEEFAKWEDAYAHRANFGFSYDQETGRKTMKVLDVGDSGYGQITKEALNKFGEILKNAKPFGN